MTFPGRPLTDILASTAIDMPEAKATSFLGATLTFLELKRRSDALAAALVDLGIGQGDRVGIMLPNCPQYIIATFAILRVGRHRRQHQPELHRARGPDGCDRFGHSRAGDARRAGAARSGHPERDRPRADRGHVAGGVLGRRGGAAARRRRADARGFDRHRPRRGAAARRDRAAATWRSSNTRAARPARRKARC